MRGLDVLNAALRRARQAAGSLRRRGLRECAELALDHAEGVWFDRRTGTRTMGYLTIEGRGDVGTSSGYHYIGVPPRELRRALRVLNVAPSGRFVDLGCGKGRGMIVAAEHGFTALRGVDFMAGLAAEARANLAAFGTARGRALDVDVRTLDAAEFEPSPDESVYFAFNPFPAEVLAAVLDAVEASLRTAPRDVAFLYVNPAHAAVFDERPAWRRAGVSAGRRFETFAFRPAPRGEFA